MNDERPILPPMANWTAIPFVLFTAFICTAMAAWPVWFICKFAMGFEPDSAFVVGTGLALTVGIVAMDAARHRRNLENRIADLEARPRG